jgi:hypothetical protein
LARPATHQQLRQQPLHLLQCDLASVTPLQLANTRHHLLLLLLLLCHRHLATALQNPHHLRCCSLLLLPLPS